MDNTRVLLNPVININLVKRIDDEVKQRKEVGKRIMANIKPLPKHYLSLGDSDDTRQMKRENGMLWSALDLQQAANLANMHNDFFLGSMISPNIDPEFAKLNPSYAFLVAGLNALFLPTQLSWALPGGASTHGLINLIGENGILKTIDLYRNGQYSAGALSLGGDVFNGALATVPAGRVLLNNTRAGQLYQLSNAVNKSVKNTKLLRPKIENIGWGPKLTIGVSHVSDSSTPLTLFNLKRWDVVNEGANPHGVWFQGKLGYPRTEFTNPGKGLKAENARELFNSRPFKFSGNLTLNKPIITIGEVSNRSNLSYLADLMGADGIIYNGVYDNGFNNNQVLLSFTPAKGAMLTSEGLPSKPINFLEKLGLPKGVRNNMSRLQLDALEDATRVILEQFPYIDSEGNFSWSTEYRPEMFQKIINYPNARVSTYGRNGTSISWKNDKGFYNFRFNGNKRLADFSTEYLEELPNGEFVGDASMMATPKDIKIFITSPKAEGGQSPTVDKKLMRNFWEGLENVSKQGQYISGDQMGSPLGAYLRPVLLSVMKPVHLGNNEIKLLVTTRYLDFINKLMSKPTFKTHTDGLSTDSYLAILKQAARPGSKYSLRFSTDGMESFNSLSFENKHIYDLLDKAKSGQIPKEQFIQEFNNWVKPYNGMNAKILKDGTIWMPHPFLIKRKQGGRLIPKALKGISSKYSFKIPKLSDYESSFSNPFIDRLLSKNSKDKNPNDIYHKFTSRNFDEFVRVMVPIILTSLKKYNYPTKMTLNILRQMALESAYGTDPRGSKGFNLGGIKWFSTGGTSKYNHTKYSGDNLEYVDFDNLQDYTDYKVQLLNNTYDALNAVDTNDFISRLHSNNPNKKSYSASPDTYRKVLNGTVSLDRAYNNYINKK